MQLFSFDACLCCLHNTFILLVHYKYSIRLLTQLLISVLFAREHAIADYLENNGYTEALEAFKKDAKIVIIHPFYALA